MAKIKSITKHKIQSQKLYNLAVEEDQSYFINDVLVHNCDGWLSPILIGNLKGRKPSKFTPTKKALESLQFSECCKKLDN